MLSNFTKKKIEQAIAKYKMIGENETVLCALSGGADSIAMTFAMHEMGIKIKAAHFIHGLRPNDSEQELALVQTFCQKLGLELFWQEGDTHKFATENKLGCEEAARILRYDFLQKQAEICTAEKIATAHHLQDNAETVLLNLARGTGIAGLCGIPPIRQNIIRPMICVSRAEIMEIIEKNNLPYATDPTNQKEIFGRNKLRHKVMPVLNEINSKSAEKIMESCEIMRDDAQFISQATSDFIKNNAEITENCAIFDVNSLKNAPKAIASRAIIAAGKAINSDITLSMQNIQDILRLCEGENPSKRCSLPNSLLAKRQYEKLVLQKENPENLLNLQILEQNIPLLTQNLRITLDGYAQKGDTIYRVKKCAITMPIFVRARKQGDKIVFGGHHKSIKKLMIERKFPADLRDNIPLICDESGVLILCASGKFLCADKLQKIAFEATAQNVNVETKSEEYYEIIIQGLGDIQDAGM